MTLTGIRMFECSELGTEDCDHHEEAGRRRPAFVLNFAAHFCRTQIKSSQVNFVALLARISTRLFSPTHPFCGIIWAW
jgi:hypothetical protein